MNHRSIVAVANGMASLQASLGEAIDSFDEVVRFNDAETSPDTASQLGFKTTIWAFCDWPEQIYSKAEPRFSRCRQLFVTPDLPGKHNVPTPPQAKRIPLAFERELRRRVSPREGTWCSTGLITIAWLLQEYESIHTVGWLEPQAVANEAHYFRHYYAPQRTFPWLGHDLRAERRLFDGWIQQGRVSPLSFPSNGTPQPVEYPTKKLTCVIPCKHRLAHLKQGLPSLLEGAKQNGYEVLVVDYDCPDHTFEWCQVQRHPRLHCVRVLGEGDQFNASRARNCGIQIADTEFVLTLDADCVAQPRFVEMMLRPVLDGSGVSHAEIERSDGSVHPGHGILAFPRSSWLAVGGFDEQMSDWGYEDTDFFDRLKQLSSCHKLYATPKEIVILDHGHIERAGFYAEQDVNISWRRNYEHAQNRKSINPHGFAEFNYTLYRGDTDQTRQGYCQGLTQRAPA